MTSSRTVPEQSGPAATPGPASAGRLPRFGWRDPLLLACCAAALLVYLPHGFAGYLTRDIALYSYAGQQFAEGVPPYLAVVNRAGPLAHAVPGVGAIGARAVGIDDLLGMRVLFMLISVACVAGCYLLGRDVFRSRLAGLGAAATLLYNESFITYATYGPREKTVMVLFFVCALFAMTHRRWATTGFFIALATLTWQPVFLAAIAGAGVAVWLGERNRRLRGLVRVAVGGLVPTLLVVGSYAAIGKLDVFLNDFVLINARYTKQRSLLSDPGAVAELMWHGYGPSLVLFSGGLVAMVALSGWMLTHRGGRDDRAFVMLMASCAMLAAGLLFALKAFNGWPDVFFLIPLAGLGLGGALSRLRVRVPRAGLVVAVVLCLVVTGLGLAFSIGNRDDTLEDQRRDVVAVLELLPADARILSVEAPQPLVLAGKRNPTLYQQFGNGLIDYVDDTWPDGRDGYARDVLDREPTVIALGDLDDPAEWMTSRMFDYRMVGASAGWDWYVHEDVGAETLAAVRAELE